MQVRSCGFKNGGSIQMHTLAEGSTLGDLAQQLELSAGNCAFSVDGVVADVSTVLQTGNMVSYTQTNIKGA